MSILRAVVFTRPYPIGLGDYTFFVRPAEFDTDRKYFDDHIRNVLHEDDSSTIGGIRGRRWHVLRRGNIVVVGMATNEFGRRDESGRAIRGYYGFAMPANDVALPSDSLFKELDKICVEPVFMQAPVRAKDANLLMGGLFDDKTLYKKAVDSHKWRFNTDSNKIRCHCCDDVGSILSSAIAEASQNHEFEIVIGLNTIAHAQRLPILNCVCHAVLTPKDIPIPSSESDVDHEVITTRKPDRPEHPRKDGYGAKGRFPDGGAPTSKIPTSAPSEESFPARKPSLWKRTKILFGRNAEPTTVPVPLGNVARSSGAEPSHKVTARSLQEQGFKHTPVPEERDSKDGIQKDKPSRLDAHIEECPSDAAWVQKSGRMLDTDKPLIAVLGEIARLQDEINEMKKESNDSSSLKLDRIVCRLDEIMELGGALPVDGEGVFGHLQRPRSRVCFPGASSGSAQSRTPLGVSSRRLYGRGGGSSYS